MGPVFLLKRAFLVTLEVLGDPKRAPVSQVTSIHLVCSIWEALFAFLNMLGLKGSRWGAKMGFLAPIFLFWWPLFWLKYFLVKYGHVGCLEQH